MRLKKYQKEIARGMEALKASTKPYKTRSAFEVEKVITTRYKAVARRRQIELVKLDNNIPFAPFDLLQYTVPNRRKQVWTVIGAYVRLLLP